MQNSEGNRDGWQDKNEQITGVITIEGGIERGYMSGLGLEFRSRSNPEEWLREHYPRVNEKPQDGKVQEPEVGIARET